MYVYIYIYIYTCVYVYIYIYIYTHIHIHTHIAVSSLFATTTSIEALSSTIFGVTCCLGGEAKVTPKIVPFSKNSIAMKFHYTSKVEPPILFLS